jgi:hypothetical protein
MILQVMRDIVRCAISAALSGPLCERRKSTAEIAYRDESFLSATRALSLKQGNPFAK